MIKTAYFSITSIVNNTLFTTKFCPTKCSVTRTRCLVAFTETIWKQFPSVQSEERSSDLLTSVVLRNKDSVNIQICVMFITRANIAFFAETLIFLWSTNSTKFEESKTKLSTVSSCRLKILRWDLLTVQQDKFVYMHNRILCSKTPCNEKMTKF